MKMFNNTFIKMIIKTLKEIKSPRFYKTERGFQGKFSSNLNKLLTKQKVLPDGIIIEEEYQKSLKSHGITQRPDLIIHVPIETSHSSDRKENNYIVFAFKLNGNKTKVMKDFEKLDEIIDKLDYPIGIFINIDSLNSYLGEYQGPNKDKLYEFCIKKINSKIKILCAYFKDGEIIVAEK